MGNEASPEMEEYFTQIQLEVDRAMEFATKARKQGHDPEPEVAVKLAKNMAERVEGLISVVAPQLVGSGVTARMLELEKEYAPLDWRVALKIAHEVALEKFCKFKDKKEAMEVGIRTGFAYQTGGIVSAPLEGFIEIKIKKTREGREYFAPCYAGPIRGAGGTAASFSLLLTDYVRIKMGYDRYDPTEKEVGRYKTEIYDYHERVTNLQYLPSLEELDFLVRHLPIEIDGDPTEERDVSNYKDIERIETNKIRGGMCLVLAEGLSQKAPKLWKRLEKWGAEFDLDWGFLKEFLVLQKEIKAKKAEKKSSGKKERISANYTFVTDIVGGRPVLTLPMASGGFRLRYGRTRLSGFSAAAIHPATMVVLDDFIAVGTQLKVERPGKAAAITPCGSLSGPIVLLENGDVLSLHTVAEAKKVTKKVKEILYLGDILFNYGDFSENGHILVPPGYCEEWWVQELEKAVQEKEGSFQEETVATQTNTALEIINELFTKKGIVPLTFELAKKLSQTYGVPLHPTYQHFWNEVDFELFKTLLLWLENIKIIKEETSGKVEKIILPYTETNEIANNGKRALELIGIEHIVANNEFVVIEKDTASGFLANLGVENYNDAPILQTKINLQSTILENVQSLSSFQLRDKSGTFIGARMGRPEKAKMRKMTGSPHVLFPVGEEGGRLRSFQTAMEKGYIESTFPLYYANGKETVYPIHHLTGEKAERKWNHPDQGLLDEPVDFAKPFLQKKIEIKEYFNAAVKKMKTSPIPNLIKGIRGTSNEFHVTEQLAKGVLRAKHKVHVNKDGTVRFDMSEVPVTHFKPGEVQVSVEKLITLGYTKDIEGKPLTDPQQVLEIKPQDIIIPAGENNVEMQGEKVMINVSRFIDELLTSFYGIEPFYNIKTKEDLAGHLVLALAPHISAGMVGRIIGFSQTQGFFAHPMFHAALRRDCDGDEGSISLLLDGLLNFSRQYLPNRRGAKTMDAPLVLTSKLVPSEVDDQAHGLDVVTKYPLEFYEAALKYTPPWEIPIEQLNNRLGTPQQYEQIGYTHPVDDMNEGVMYSAYKSLPSMGEKLEGQMELAKKIRAVKASFVATLTINKHFVRDTKGNLRKFSLQRFRCVACNEKYRRPPLIGRCTTCNGKVIFTISQGSIVKYLEPSIHIAEKYGAEPYISQTLMLLKKRVESIFGKDKEKQEALEKWFG